MARVLVTGGLGFIGSHLTKKLVEYGYSVTVIDRDRNKEVPPWLQGHQVYFDDCASENSLALLREGNFSTVYHLAASPRVPWSVENPLVSKIENLDKAVMILEALRFNPRKPRFVFTSSSSVYGDMGPWDSIFSWMDTEPTRTMAGFLEMPPEPPKSPYALHKLQVEKTCALYEHLYGMDTICLRLFNVYGPGQVPEDSYSTVVCRWMEALARNKTLYVYGDGSIIRDMVYVGDVVQVLVACEVGSGNPLTWKKKQPHVVNVGTGKSYTVKVLLDMVLRTSGVLDPNTPSPRVQWTNPRKGDVPWTRAAYTSITKVFGEGVCSTPIQDGLMKTWEWWQEKTK